MVSTEQTKSGKTKNRNSRGTWIQFTNVMRGSFFTLKSVVLTDFITTNTRDSV